MLTAAERAKTSMRKAPTSDPRAVARELALAKASLRRDWRLARKYGLDKLTDEEIDAEIDIVRAELAARLKKPSSA